MALRKFGPLRDPKLQPGWSVRENVDGSWESTLVYKGDRTHRNRMPQVGDRHPSEAGLYCYSRELTYDKTEFLLCTAQYMGIKQDPSPPYVQFPGGTGQDPIETHPNFANFAGTANNPANGAYWNTETGEFIGFISGPRQGVRSYFVPNTIVNVTYYTFRVPQILRVARVFSGNLPNFQKPPNVLNWLVIGMPYEKVGPLYKVTETYLGSDTRGWDPFIYLYG